MSASPTLPLSPSFGRARTLSRIMAMFFTIAFWFMLFVLVANLLTAIFPRPNLGIGLEHGIRIPTGALRGWQAVGASVAVNLILVPELLILHYTRKLFFCFAGGEVFAAKSIAHIRAAGLWLILSFFTGIAAIVLLDQCGLKNFLFFPPLAAHPDPYPHHYFPGGLIALFMEFKAALFTGIAATIAAYVMGEAQRIADENASIL
jgi:hypothetical protein